MQRLYSSPVLKLPATVAGPLIASNSSKVVLDIVFVCCENIWQKSKDVIRLRELLQNTQFTASLDSIPCYEEDADSAPLEEREMLAGKVFLPKRAKLFRERIWEETLRGWPYKVYFAEMTQAESDDPPRGEYRVGRKST